jgi:hypothetical protein
MTRKEYNGWFNYETWLIKVWIDNEPWTYHEVKEQAEGFGDKDEFRKWFKDWIENQVLDGLQSTSGNLTMDLAMSAFSEANLDEIVDSYIGDYPEYFEAEEEEEEVSV